MKPNEKTANVQEKENIIQLRQSSRLKITDPVTMPPVILQVNDSIIGTLGNFSASTGKAKSKKNI